MQKPGEPMTHQYDYDAQTVIGFLKQYGLDKEFKLNIEPNHTELAGHSTTHDVAISSALGMLGSIDSNTGNSVCGWDTDKFPMNVNEATMIMQYVLKQGGIAPGGLNFDCKARRESVDIEDLFIGHIAAMDTYARGLRNAARLLQDGVIPRMVEQRYSSFANSELGKKIENNQATLEDCEEYARNNPEPKALSGKEEKFEAILNHYI